ncbi:hypothetical protein K504DRAFT_300135 [Pleomassaria siparia CBS 279.74]|uniref:Uncharacterized protein n=1 Tax=Pleomassaria siparia CBS 279.74 TaxID=1314801 RepID=A0A6G1K5W7_9PLEO|nr:hypothetical protein K504DRAFT_300135 [Pleomassaria siparia CBS 279.74]
MCHYRYTYYAACGHAELYRHSYCNTTLRLQQSDPLYGNRSGTYHNSYAGEQSLIPSSGSSSHPHHHPPSAASLRKPPPGPFHSQNHYTMSTIAPSGAGNRFSWADVAASEPDTDALSHVDFIPRSVQPEAGAAGPYPQPFGREGSRHGASKSSSALDTAGYSNLNMNIPLGPYSSLSMQLTHPDGKVQEIIARFETCAHGVGSLESHSNKLRADAGNPHTRASSSSTIRQTTDASTDTDTVRALPINGSRDNSFTRDPVATDTQSDRVVQFLPGLVSTPRTIRGGNGQGADPNLNGKQTTPACYEEFEDEPQSARKSIPPQWMAKIHAPTLKTAQRAKDRQTRKKTLHGESPIESGARTLRGARSSVDLGKSHCTEATTFLTKGTAAPVECDITSQPFIHSPKTLRHARSKSSIKSPSGSPIRDSPGRSLDVTVSNFGLDGAHHSTTAANDGGSDYQSAVSSAGNTPYASARHSPMANPSDGMSSLRFIHLRRKSEPRVKVAVTGGNANLNGPCAPKLSLRIPHPSPSSTDRKPPFTLGSASSSGSGTPASPSQSSRIPRMSSTVKTDPGTSHPVHTLRKTKSSKALVQDKENKAHDGNIKGSCPPDKVTATDNAGTDADRPQEIATSATHAATATATATAAELEQALSIANTAGTSRSVGGTVASKKLAIPGMIKPTAEARFDLEEWISGSSEISQQNARRETSGSTVKGTSSLTTFRDPAILFSSKRSGASGTAQSESPFDDSSSSFTSARIDVVSATASHYKALPIRSKDKEISKASQGSNAPSALRATAPVFEPKQQSRSVAGDQPSTSSEWSRPQGSYESQLQQLQQPNLPFDPFTLDFLYKINLYHHMYPVSNLPTNYDGRGSSKSPRKGKRKGFIPYCFTPYQKGRGRQPRVLDVNSSPTKPERSGDTGATDMRKSTDPTSVEPITQEEDISTDPKESISTPRPLPDSKAQAQTLGADGATLQGSVGPSQGNIPLALQMDGITRQGSGNDTETAVGRASRQRIDWSSIHNVPLHSQMSQMESPYKGYYPRNARSYRQHANDNPTSGQNPQPPYSSMYHPRQPYYRKHGGNGLYDNFSPAYLGRNHHAAAGVPMHATAPFPDPLPPPGHQTRVEGGTRNKYVGYGAPAKERVCGEVKIEQAQEDFFLRVCNDCDTK